MNSDDIFYCEPPTKVGRPKKKDEERRDVEFRVRLTPVEYARLKEVSEAYGRPMADILRSGLKEPVE